MIDRRTSLPNGYLMAIVLVQRIGQCQEVSLGRTVQVVQGSKASDAHQSVYELIVPISLLSPFQETHRMCGIRLLPLPFLSWDHMFCLCTLKGE